MAETYCKDAPGRQDRLCRKRLETGAKKSVTICTEYEIINRTIDKYGQYLFPNDIEATIWWINLGMNDHDVIDLHNAHGVRIQFHSDIKTDMYLER